MPQSNVEVDLAIALRADTLGLSETVDDFTSRAWCSRDEWSLRVSPPLRGHPSPGPLYTGRYRTAGDKLYRESCRCRPGASSDRGLLLALFFLSGGAALIYQVTWQRMLFAVFGVDLESVTVIVSVFMFGLGVGALLGGVVADRFGGRLLIIFAGVELGIGMFGFFSPGLIDLLNASVAGSDRVVAALGSFAVLAIPTTLMGGTLPVLVTHVNRFDPHIGQAVGQLYFANTAGAAVGAYLVGYHLLRWVDLTGAIHTAAGINVLVAVTALVAFGRK